MHIITRKTLRQFWERHPDAAEVLKDWHDNAEHANWTSPQQIKTDYPSASIIGGDRVVFNIKGNNYRLVVHIRGRCISVSLALTPNMTELTPERFSNADNHGD